MSLMASTSAGASTLATVKAEDQWPSQIKHIGPMSLQFRPLDKRTLINHAIRTKQASIICSAALNATCAEGQTQTVTRQSSTITVAPVQGKERSPELDDGGTGFPPGDDGDGGGGGGGGGGNWSGGFFFFGFLAFLGFLKDQESEGPYRDERRRR